MVTAIASGLILCLICMMSLSIAAVESPFQAAFRQVEVLDASAQAPFPVVLWYPTYTAAEKLQVGSYTMEVARNAPPATGVFPVVMISHGARGGMMNHRDLALHLARQGYLVAAPMHPHDNFKDMSGTGSWDGWVGRPKHVSQTIDWITADPTLSPHLQPERTL